MHLAHWVIGTDPALHPFQSVWLSCGRCMLFSCLCGMASSCFLIKRPIQTFSLRGIANLRSHSLRSTTCLDLRGQNQICCHEELSLGKNGMWFIIPNHTHRADNQRGSICTHMCAHTCMWRCTYTHKPTLHPFTLPPHINTYKTDQHMFWSLLILWLNHSYMLSEKNTISHRCCLAPRSLAVRSWITCFLQTATTSPSTQGSSLNAPF